MKHLIFILILTLLISGCQILPRFLVTDTPVPPTAAITPTPTLTLPTPSATPLPVAPTPTPAKPLLLGSQSLFESSANPEYTLRVYYPQFEQNKTPQMQAFNDFSKQMAKELMDSYLSELAKSQVTPDPNFHPSFMETTYQVTNGTHGLLSILFRVADYWSGAAHPNQYFRVMNFNLIAGKEIMLADLFLPGSNFIQSIADYCIADLKKQDRLMFEAGAQPEAVNYQNWNITPEGLQISFDPYQVGPYALGPSTVAVPYTSLKQIINPAGPLAPYYP